MAKSDKDRAGVDRRGFIRGSGKAIVGGGLAAAGVHSTLALAKAGEQGTTAIDESNLRYSDPEWNRDAFARIMGDLDFGKEKFGWFGGTVCGVVPNEKVKPLVGFEGFSYARIIDEGNGVYAKVLRELGFYTDLKTGEVLEEWTNPYTDETVKVVHIANDPFNFKITSSIPAPPEYGGLNSADKPKDIPLILPWKETPDGKVMLQSNIHLFYPSALQPEKWPRESSGKMNQVSEMFTYVFDKADLADPSVTSLSFSGSWGRITPWLPWMLMGQADGHIYYDCLQGGYKSMDVVSKPVLEYAKKHYPKYFSAPEKWEEPSLSSLEHYALEQKPAPVKK